jgi:hypothetical protein
MATDENPPVRRRFARSGPTALIASAILVLWVILGVWLALIAVNNTVAGVIATIIFFASWIVIPALVVLIVVFAIIALLFNPVPGKIMGAFAIVLPIAVGVLFWNSIGGFSEQFLGS